MKYSSIILFLTLLIGACHPKNGNKVQSNKEHAFSVQLEQQDVNTDASFRGICAVDDQIVWASGTQGTVLKTTDGGTNWEKFTIQGADTLDFRDIEAFDENTAYILSAGQPARLYKTVDGGKSWELQYESKDPEAFFDGLSFWDKNKGFAMSDPVKGEFLIIKTEDGENWIEVPAKHIPDTIENEGGFAASGTNVVTKASGKAWFVTGGPAARIFKSEDYGDHWEVYNTPVHSQMEYAGIYSVAFKDSNYGIAVGGSFAHPDSTLNNAAITTDGGKSWELIETNGPNGYRSCVAYLPFTKSSWITVSRTGGDISHDDGKTWTTYTDEIYYSFSIGKNSTTGWLSGPKGRIAKVTFK